MGGLKNNYIYLVVQGGPRVDRKRWPLQMARKYMDFNADCLTLVITLIQIPCEEIIGHPCEVFSAGVCGLEYLLTRYLEDKGKWSYNPIYNW